jgi:peptidoglycan hydrolase CwlO-like protein
MGELRRFFLNTEDKLQQIGGAIAEIRKRIEEQQTLQKKHMRRGLSRK